MALFAWDRVKQTKGISLANVIFFPWLLKLQVCHKNSLLLWVSTNSEEGSMGRKSVCLGLWPLFSSQAQSGQLRWVACWAADVWIKGRADVFPVPPSSELWTSLCVYSWPQRASVLHSSQQLAAVLSQASSVCWSRLYDGQTQRYDLLQYMIVSAHSILSKASFFDLHEVSPNS